jgi:hypothetical protein
MTTICIPYQSVDSELSQGGMAANYRDKCPIQITSGGCNSIRLTSYVWGDAMSPSNTVRWDVIHASYSVDDVMLNGQLNSGIQN